MKRRKVTSGCGSRSECWTSSTLRLAVACLVCALAGSFAGSVARAQQAAEAPDALAAILPELKSQTRVPILLPRKLPTLSKTTYYPHIKGDAVGYTIRIDSDPDCDGANACFLGMLRAKRGGRYSFPDVVKLGETETARYKPITCGGSCSAATIEWKYEGVLYIAQMNLKTENEKEARAEMIELAKSAVASGPR